MKTPWRAFLLLVLTVNLASCGENEAGKNGSIEGDYHHQPPTVTPPNSCEEEGTGESGCGKKAEDPVAKLILTDDEKEEIHSRLYNSINEDYLNQFSFEDKIVIVGAYLEQVMKNVHPLILSKLNEEDLRYLVELNFDQNYNFKK